MKFATKLSPWLHHCFPQEAYAAGLIRTGKAFPAV